jgi:succinate dehydrogenase / fumarate reductase cytochrome b subunit|tara:strand:- start:239 stop:898 length:660 start_codon:yes stop_codon:yes gene_type:complete
MNLLFSTIGKKIQVALSGILLAVFLIFHLMNNLVLFAGEDSFNQMVGFLEGIKPIIRVMEFGLLSILLMHTINALRLTYQNKSLREIDYSKSSQETSTLNSRTMAISGSFILVFIFIHLGYIWLTYQMHSFSVDETYYSVLLRSELGYLNHTPTAIFYILAIFFIGFHLKHGYQSALKTLGLINSGATNILYYLGFIFWGIIPLGFIIIILSIQLGYIN